MEKKKILIVEDEIIVSTSMVLTLGRKGYDCIVVTSGEEAIEALENYEPDIILMDIGLDGSIDGISTAGIIRRQYTNPIVFVTEQINTSVFQQAMGAVPQNYLNKPYTDAALVQAVEMALNQPVAPGNPVPGMPLGERVSDGIFVYVNGEYVKVLFTDILYLEADSMTTNMYCAMNKHYIISLPSNKVVAQLACPGIVRTGRSHYVNIHRIDSIKQDELMVDKKTVPMGKTYKADVLSRVTKITQK
jgi:two-component system, response regulator PdtaR